MLVYANWMGDEDGAEAPKSVVRSGDGDAPITDPGEPDDSFIRECRSDQKASSLS